MVVNARTVTVRLEVTGAGTFKSDVAGAAGSLRQVDEAAGKLTASGSGTVTMLGKLGETAKTAIGSFIGFGSAQAAMLATAEAAKIVREEVLGVNDAVQSASAVFGGVTSKMRSDMVAMSHDLAIQWGVAASTVANGFKELADQGLNAEQALGALPQLVAFSKASMLDLGTATNDVVGVLYSFGLVSSNVATNTANVVKVTDMLTKGADLTHASIAGMSEALAKVAPIATALNIPIDETIALVGQLSDVGFSGRRALLAFTNLFTDLPKQSASLAAAGINIYTAAGALRPVSGILDDLKAKLAGMSAQQIQATLTTLGFSSASEKVVLALLNSGAAIDSLDGKIKGAAGTTVSQADKIMESLANRLAQVREAAITLGIDGVEKMGEFAQFLATDFEPTFASLGSIGATVEHELEPVFKLLAGATLGGGKVAIDAFAASLNALSGFAASNKSLIEVLVIAYGVHLAAAVATTVVEFGTMLALELTTWANTAAVAVYNLATRFQTAAEEGELLQTTLATFGPVAALAAVAVATLGLVNVLNAGKQSAAALVASLTVKPTSANDWISATTQSISQQSDALDKLQQKYNSRGGISRVLGAATEILPGVSKTIGDERNQIDALAKSSEAAQKQLAAVQGEFAKIYQNVTGHNALIDVIGDPSAGFAKIERELSGIAAKANIDLSQPVGTWSDSLDKAARAAFGVAPGAQEAALAIQAVSNTASAGTDQVKAFGDALNAIFTTNFDPGDAQRAFFSAILDLKQAALTSKGIKVTWGDDASKEGLAFQDAAEKVIQNIIGIDSAMAGQGKTADQINQANKYLIVGFTNLATSLGLPQAAIDKLIKGLPTLQQLKDTKINVDASPVDTAQTKADKLTKTKIAPKADIDLGAFNTKAQVIDGKIAQWNKTPINVTPPSPATGPFAQYKTWANGGIESHVAQISPPVSRVWAEPETGGEAYIPLADSKRARSASVLSDVARRFGFGLVQSYADGGVADPTVGPYSSSTMNRSAQALYTEANGVLAVLRSRYGLGDNAYVNFISQAEMTREYSGGGNAKYGVASAGVLANGDKRTGRIQVNEDIVLANLHGEINSFELLHDAIEKEFFQVVIPHYLNTDAKIRKYFDIIGFHHYDPAHAVDFLNMAGATGAGVHTTPEDLFGYFASASIDPNNPLTGAGRTDVATLARLRAAGLVPGAANTQLDRAIAFLAQAVPAPHTTPVQQALQFLASIRSATYHAPADAGSYSGASTRDGQTVVHIPGKGRFFASGGIEDHTAQIAAPGTPRVWNEPETGGEGYVPLAPSKRQRSTAVLKDIAGRFGYDVVRMADGGIVSFAGSTISAEAYTDLLINRFASKLAGSLSFAGAANAAAAGVSPPAAGATAAEVQRYQLDRQAAIRSSLMDTAKTYTEVAQAAGKSAADQLAASGLVGDAFQNAASKIIQAAQQRHVAEQQYAEQVVATKRQLVDDEFADNKITLADYLRVLNARLAATKKYSADWLAIHEQIRSAVKAGATPAVAAPDPQTTFDKYAGPMESATSLVGAFGNTKVVSASMIEGFLQNVKQGSTLFRDAITKLTQRGYARSVVQQIAEAGPGALALAQALLNVPVSEVNGDIGDIRAIVSGSATYDVSKYGATDLSAIPVPPAGKPTVVTVKKTAPVSTVAGIAGAAAFGAPSTVTTASHVDHSVHLTVGSIPIDMRGAIEHPINAEQAKAIASTAVATGLTQLVAKVERDLRSGAKSPTG